MRFTLTFAAILGTLLASPVQAECVVLLHGLIRSSASMEPMAESLEAASYTVANIDYPSRDLPIEELAPLAIDAGIAACPDNVPIHFVTHSMGGILVRYYLADQSIDRLGRVVMLAPPNQGSEIVDALSDVPGYELLNGPAGQQLGTDENSIPSQLGPVDFEVGVIAGTRTFDPLMSQFLPNPDDGRVSVSRTRVEGMQDFITVPHTHAFIMRAETVIEQVKHFLREGVFKHDDA